MAGAEAGTTVKVSLPFGVPDREMPKVYTLPLMDILDGVALDNVAVPPLMENEKSPTTRAELASVVVYTASLNVTARVLLAAAKDTEDMVGTVLSTTIAEPAARLVPMEKLLMALPAASDRVPAERAMVFTVRSLLASPD